MPAPLTPLHDETPFGGDGVNSAVRIAWLLRMARLGSGGGHSQAAVGAALRATGVRTHARLMSEIENGKVRRGRVVDGYERALGLREGQLRAPVDVLCHNLPGAPEEKDDASRTLDDQPLSVEEISARGERVRDPRRTGGAWLSWARAVTAPEAHGFPTWLAAPWLDELVDELGRSVGTAYVTRYQTLSLLRGSAYGDLVLDAARRAVAEPHAQVVVDIVGAATDHPDHASMVWAAELLSDPRPMALRAGCHALLNAAGYPALPADDWDPVVEPLVAAYEAAVSRRDPTRHQMLSTAVAALPASHADLVVPRLSRPPAPGPAPRRPGGGGSHAQRRRRQAVELADRIAEPDNLPDRGLLARLLVELVHDARPHVYFSTAMLLSAVPFVDRLVDVLYRYAVHEADERDRATILYRLTQLTPVEHEGQYAELATGTLEERGHRAVLLAHAGQRVEREQLEELMAPAGQKRRAIYAAGMTQHPWLDKVAEDDSYPESVRGAARWWQEREGLVDDAFHPTRTVTG